MIDQALIKRINELARKKKESGLTEAEVQEQQQLRAQYIAAFRKSFRAQLDAIEIVD